jgi:hypothetical protein
MAFQTLGAKIGSTDKDGKWTPNDPVDNMLSRLGAELYDEGNEFVVTGDEPTVISLKPFLGALVTAYANDDDEIIAIKDVKSTYLIGNFDTALAENHVFEADKDYDIRNITSVGAIQFFLNGGTSTKAAVYDANKTEEFKIAAKVSGIKIDEIYSVALWDVTEHGYFEDADAEDIAEDQKLFGQSFALNDDDEIDLTSFELVGATSLEDIAEDSVVYVYVGNVDSKNIITKIEVGTEVVEGEITRISGTKYTIDGVAYEKAEDSVYSVTLEVKNEYKLYLDADGKIYDAELLKGEADKLAIVLASKNGSEGTFGTTPEIYLFLADGTDKVFEADAKEINDTNFIATTGSLNWASKATDGAILKYSVDADGVIDGLAEAGLANVTTSKGAFDVSSTGYMDGYKIADDAVVFTIESFDVLSDDADDYGVVSAKSLYGAKDVVANYALKDGLINLIVMESSATADDDVFGVYDSSKAIVSADPGYEVRLLVDGSAVVYGANSASYTKAAVADGLYLVVFDTDGAIKELKAATGTDINTLVVTAGATTGATISVVNRVATITDTDVTVDGINDYSDSTREVSLASDVVVYKLNSEGKWAKGSLSDIRMTEKKSVNVTFYDVYGDDKVADIVLVK